jgi:hypothetical protein
MHGSFPTYLKDLASALDVAAVHAVCALTSRLTIWCGDKAVAGHRATKDSRVAVLFFVDKVLRASACGSLGNFVLRAPFQLKQNFGHSRE